MLRNAWGLKKIFYVVGLFLHVYIYKYIDIAKVPKAVDLAMFFGLRHDAPTGKKSGSGCSCGLFP